MLFILEKCFIIYDWLWQIVTKYVKQIEIVLLVLAHLTWIWMLMPASRREVGEFSLNLLLLMLFLSPVAFITKSRLLTFSLRFRKQLGIAMGYTAIIHSLGYILDSAWFNYVITKHWPNIFSILPNILFGFLALILTLPLLFTSNKFFTNLLKRNWKKLHRLVYVIFVAVVLHKNLRLGRNDTSLWFGALQSLPIILLFIFLKLLAKYDFIAPLRRCIEYIRKQYLDYQIKKKAAEQVTV